MSKLKKTDLRVFVTYKQDTVFAGETVECTITFKNVEQIENNGDEGPSTPHAVPQLRTPNPLDPLRAARASSTNAPSQGPFSRNNSVSGIPQRRPSRHKQASSLNIVDSAIEQPSSAPPSSFKFSDTGPKKPKHGRSVSIISLGSEPTTQNHRQSGAAGSSQQRPGFSHGRSASVQAASSSRGRGRPSPSISAPGWGQPWSQPSPLSQATTPTIAEVDGDMRNARPNFRKGSSDTRSPITPGSFGAFRPPNFKFPATYPPSQSPRAATQRQDFPNQVALPERARSPISQEEAEVPDRLQRPPFGRVFSVQSMDDTPRTSGEFYSAAGSNNSEETMVSDIPAQQTTRLLKGQLFGRSSSKQRKPTPTRTSETLMMGYAQIVGEFTLDGSLVNQSPFDEVKRKAVVGGQGGGGVVGVQRKNGDSGFLGSFGWGSIGETLSLGNLLGVGEQSSIKEMKDIADSQAIPLISTAKSILFVDLKLEPGESRSYSYSFRIPKGLPPSHRGRAMKVTYKVIIGTQRPNAKNSGQQNINQVSAPFRLLGSVNSVGETLDHDLMSPYIFLKDQATTKSLNENDSPMSKGDGLPPASPQTPLNNSSGEADFHSYVNHLLTKSSENTLLSPTADLASPHPNNALVKQRTRSISENFASGITTQQPLTAQAIIENALRHSMNPQSPIHAPSHYTIARSGRPIATLILLRPVLRLGDLITVVIDFNVASPSSGANYPHTSETRFDSNAPSARYLPSYAIEATLESAETVDPSLAIRSATSIERVTRRVHARHVENVIWAKRIGFIWQVPTSATPGFGTTGVGLEWCIRLEMVVGTSDGQPRRTTPQEQEDEEVEDYAEENMARSDDSDDEPASSPRRRRKRGPAHARRSVALAREPRRSVAARSRPPVSKADQLLDFAHQDDRGTLLVAKQKLNCESFEVTIPLKVYGNAAVAGAGKDPAEEDEGYSI